MKNFVQPGDTIQLKAEDANNVGKKSGDLVTLASGKYFAVAASDNPAVTGQTFAGMLEGVFQLPKLAEGLPQGQRVFWQGSGITATPTGAAPVGTVMDTALTGDTTVNVLINEALPSLTGTL
jgi:predicted RecA/RadA family phage recombinase